MKTDVLAGVAMGSLLALMASAALAGDYTVLTTGRPSGLMTVTGEGAARTVAYSYTDRGRGPDLKESYRLGPDGYPQTVSTTGVDYLKAPVDETFERAGARATWSSQADAGSSEAKGFYVTYQSTPEDFAVLLRALLKAPGGRLDLLPAGEARVRKVLDRQVTGPARQTETVT